MDYKVSECSNYNFSKLNSLDLKQLLFDLNILYVRYRNLLNMSNDKLTFGVEIEFESCSIESIRNAMNNDLEDWILKKDHSLKSGGEVNSPILMDSVEDWKNLRSICNILKEKHATATENCGAHIHFGSDIFGNNFDNWLTLIKCWTVYEKVLYRVSYGAMDRARRPLKKYAPPVANTLNNIVKELKDCSDASYLIAKLNENISKRSGINFKGVNVNNPNSIKNTIEIRCPNGTIEEVFWQNNINIFGKLLCAIKDNRIDIELLDNYISKNDFNSSLQDYQEIYMKEALEFADMVFDNNLDKMYFLRQYLKNSSKTSYEQRQKTFIMK